MIDHDRVTGIVVTRGDVGSAAEESLAPLGEVVVWNNAEKDVDLSVYGRYAAIEEATNRVVLVIDDDVALPAETIDLLLAAYVPGKLVAIMPPEYRARYPDSALVGFGAIFDRHLPAAAFATFRAREPLVDNAWFQRACDIVFSMLTPRLLVDFPFEMLPHTRAPNRMYRQAGNTEERQRMIRLCRWIRDGR